MQHLTLGEAYKALNKYEESAFNFRKCLELHPNVHTAEIQLKEVEAKIAPTNFYTIVIILMLIVSVLIMIYYLLSNVNH
jgi:tetratricopeptide (TPR) repeat protein